MSEKRVIMPETSADDLDADFADGGTRPLRLMTLLVNVLFVII